MDPSEPRWRTNSSFSPPVSRRWDCRFQSDGSSHRVHEAPTYESSVSSHSKDSTTILNANQYSNHYHSASDGALAYLESPSENFQTTRWTPQAQRFDLGEFSTPIGGGRPESSEFSKFNERRFQVGSGFPSPSPLSESRRWASSSKQPILFPPRNFSGRRSFISKPVYPLVFRNPVSNADTSGNPETNTGGRMTPDDDSKASPWSDRNLSPELKFHRALAEFQKVQASPDLNASSRRDGFRWSNGSSYDFGLEDVDFPDHISIESQTYINSSARSQKCGLCERWLWQKSPCSSNRMVRSTDMPIAGVLHCYHVFHADCLEEATPKSQIHDPPCPLCLKADGTSLSFSEPLQSTLRFVPRTRVDTVSTVAGNSSNLILHHVESNLRHNHTLLNTWKGSSLKRHLKTPFSFKGKMGKDLFRAKIFKKMGSSSSSLFTEKPESSRAKKNL